MEKVQEAQSPTVGRFAPSPTGRLHLGSLVAAVGSYLLARREGGKWLLRMEDLDLPRVVPGAADDILRTLEALCLEWDGEVVYQSRRTEVYEEAFRSLVARRLAYSCGCSRNEIAQISSAPHGAELLYPGVCREGLPPGKSERAFRVKVYDEVVTFQDGIVGVYGQTLSASCGDFVIRRGDGPFAYHLAVVVDDAAMGVNQVVRGSDLLFSTPRQIYLQRLLQLETPRYYHLPLVTGSDGAKLSKREAAVSIAEGGNLGSRGGRLIAGALRFLGQDVPEEYEREGARALLAQAASTFELSRVPVVPGPFPGSTARFFQGEGGSEHG